LPTLHRAVWLTNAYGRDRGVGRAWCCSGWAGACSGAIVVGLLAGGVIGFGHRVLHRRRVHAPTQNIARQAESGTGPCIISGVAEGMLSVWIPNVDDRQSVLCWRTDWPAALSDGGFMLGLYGVGIAAVGMLSTLGITLATDAYGPIADNAGGNAEMSGLPREVRERTDALDSLGNTTAAIGKGFAIGSAALTALALLASLCRADRVYRFTGKSYDRNTSRRWERAEDHVASHRGDRQSYGMYFAPANGAEG
jgi:Na+/H+-translocating membrane pyrophosphatase